MKKICAHPTSLFHIVTVGPFGKSGADFMVFHLVSMKRHMYIIVVMNYFTRQAKAMPTITKDGETIAAIHTQ